PHSDVEIHELAEASGVPAAAIRAQTETLRETNPMLGHRGCRLGISYPAIYEMQTRAIIEAAVSVQKTHGTGVHPEIMVPLVGHAVELERLRKRIVAVAETVLAEHPDVEVSYLVGTMIELPRACLVADDIAKHADFFSFGTNDLTQTTYGISRDDAGRFISEYVNQGVYPRDPFVSIDQEGMGQLMRMAVQKGRSTRTHLKVGICGEHGGEPRSIDFCQTIGLNYVSCSPFRVPIARLAAAQA